MKHFLHAQNECNISAASANYNTPATCPGAAANMKPKCPAKAKPRKLRNQQKAKCTNNTTLESTRSSRKHGFRLSRLNLSPEETFCIGNVIGGASTSDVVLKPTKNYLTRSQKQNQQQPQKDAELENDEVLDSTLVLSQTNLRTCATSNKSQGAKLSSKNSVLLNSPIPSDSMLNCSPVVVSASRAATKAAVVRVVRRRLRAVRQSTEVSSPSPNRPETSKTTDPPQQAPLETLASFSAAPLANEGSATCVKPLQNVHAARRSNSVPVPRVLELSSIVGDSVAATGNVAMSTMVVQYGASGRHRIRSKLSDDATSDRLPSNTSAIKVASSSRETNRKIRSNIVSRSRATEIEKDQHSDVGAAAVEASCSSRPNITNLNRQSMEQRIKHSMSESEQSQIVISPDNGCLVNSTSMVDDGEFVSKASTQASNSSKISRSVDCPIDTATVAVEAVTASMPSAHTVSCAAESASSQLSCKSTSANRTKEPRAKLMAPSTVIQSSSRSCCQFDRNRERSRKLEATRSSLLRRCLLRNSLSIDRDSIAGRVNQPVNEASTASNSILDGDKPDTSVQKQVGFVSSQLSPSENFSPNDDSRVNLSRLEMASSNLLLQASYDVNSAGNSEESRLKASVMKQRCDSVGSDSPAKIESLPLRDNLEATGFTDGEPDSVQQKQDPGDSCASSESLVVQSSNDSSAVLQASCLNGANESPSKSILPEDTVDENLCLSINVYPGDTFSQSQSDDKELVSDDSAETSATSLLPTAGKASATNASLTSVDLSQTSTDDEDKDEAANASNCSVYFDAASLHDEGSQSDDYGSQPFKTTSIVTPSDSESSLRSEAYVGYSLRSRPNYRSDAIQSGQSTQLSNQSDVSTDRKFKRTKSASGSSHLVNESNCQQLTLQPEVAGCRSEELVNSAAGECLLTDKILQPGVLSTSFSFPQKKLNFTSCDSQICQQSLNRKSTPEVASSLKDQSISPCLLEDRSLQPGVPIRRCSRRQFADTPSTSKQGEQSDVACSHSILQSHATPNASLLSDKSSLENIGTDCMLQRRQNLTYSASKLNQQIQEQNVCVSSSIRQCNNTYRLNAKSPQSGATVHSRSLRHPKVYYSASAAAKLSQQSQQSEGISSLDLQLTTVASDAPVLKAKTLQSEVIHDGNGNLRQKQYCATATSQLDANVQSVESEVAALQSEISASPTLNLSSATVKPAVPVVSARRCANSTFTISETEDLMSTQQPESLNVSRVDSRDSTVNYVECHSDSWLISQSSEPCGQAGCKTPDLSSTAILTPSASRVDKENCARITIAKGDALRDRSFVRSSSQPVLSSLQRCRSAILASPAKSVFASVMPARKTEEIAFAITKNKEPVLVDESVQWSEPSPTAICSSNNRSEFYETELEMSVNDSSIRRQYLDSVHASNLYTTVDEQTVDDANIRQELIPSVRRRPQRETILNADSSRPSSTSIIDPASVAAETPSKPDDSVHATEDNQPVLVDESIQFNGPSLAVRISIPSAYGNYSGAALSSKFYKTEYEQSVNDSSIRRKYLDSVHASNLFATEAEWTVEDAIVRKELIPSISRQPHQMQTEQDEEVANMATYLTEAEFTVYDSRVRGQYLSSWRESGMFVTVDAEVTVDQSSIRRLYLPSILNPSGPDVDESLPLQLMVRSMHVGLEDHSEITDDGQQSVKPVSAKSESKIDTGAGENVCLAKATLSDTEASCHGQLNQLGNNRSACVGLESENLAKRVENLRQQTVATRSDNLTNNRPSQAQKESSSSLALCSRQELALVPARPNAQSYAEAVLTDDDSLESSGSKQSIEPAESSAQPESCTEPAASTAIAGVAASLLKSEKRALRSKKLSSAVNDAQSSSPVRNACTEATDDSVVKSVDSAKVEDCLVHFSDGCSRSPTQLLPLESYSFFCDDRGVEFDLAALQNVELSTSILDEYRSAVAKQSVETKAVRRSARQFNNPPIRLKKPNNKICVFGYIKHPVRVMDKVLIGFLDTKEHAKLKQLLAKKSYV